MIEELSKLTLNYDDIAVLCHTILKIWNHSTIDMDSMRSDLYDLALYFTKKYTENENSNNLCDFIEGLLVDESNVSKEQRGNLSRLLSVIYALDKGYLCSSSKAHENHTNSYPNDHLHRQLTLEEVTDYIELMQNGDRDAQVKLIEHNQRLVARITKKYQNIGIDNEDLISIGTIGLIKAVSTYRPGSMALATYAARCIDNEILMTIRATRTTRREVSLSEPIGTDKDGCEISLIDILPSRGDDDVIDVAERRLEAQRIAEIIHQELDARERAVMVYRYGLADGIARAQREVAKIMGISRSYISRLEARAIQKLCKRIYGG